MDTTGFSAATAARDASSCDATLSAPVALPLLTFVSAPTSTSTSTSTPTRTPTAHASTRGTLPKAMPWHPRDDPPSVRIDRVLSIGYVAASADEIAIFKVVAPFAAIEEVRVVRNKEGISVGAYVKCVDRESALRVIQHVNGLVTMEGSAYPLAIKTGLPRERVYHDAATADSPVQKLSVSAQLPMRTQSVWSGQQPWHPASDREAVSQERVLGITMIPKTADEAAIREVLARFTTIEALRVVREETTGSIQGAYIKCKDRTSALHTIQQVNGVLTMDGGTFPLAVNTICLPQSAEHGGATAAVFPTHPVAVPAVAVCPFPKLEQLRQQFQSQLQELQRQHGKQLRNVLHQLKHQLDQDYTEQVRQATEQHAQRSQQLAQQCAQQREVFDQEYTEQLRLATEQHAQRSQQLAQQCAQQREVFGVQTGLDALGTAAACVAAATPPSSWMRHNTYASALVDDGASAELYTTKTTSASQGSNADGATAMVNDSQRGYGHDDDTTSVRLPTTRPLQTKSDSSPTVSTVMSTPSRFVQDAAIEVNAASPADTIAPLPPHSVRPTPRVPTSPNSVATPPGKADLDVAAKSRARRKRCGISKERKRKAACGVDASMTDAAAAADASTSDTDNSDDDDVKVGKRRRPN